MEKEYRFSLTADLYKQAIKQAGRRYVAASGLRPALLLVNFLFFVAVGSSLFYLAASRVDDRLVFSALAAFALLYACLVVAHFGILRGAVRLNEVIGAEQRLTLSDAGIRIARTNEESILAWGAIKAAEPAKGQVLLHLDSAGVYSVPDEAFAVAGEKEQFVTEVNARCRSAAGRSTSPTVPTANAPLAAPEPLDAAKSFGFRNDLNANLVAGLRMAVFMRATDVRATWSQFAALLGIQLAIMLFCDMAAAQFRGAPSLFGLPGAMFDTVLALVAAWALALLSGRTDRTLLLLVAFSALALPLELFSQLYAHVLRPSPARGFGFSVVYFLPQYWFALAAGVGAARMLPQSLPRRLASVAVALAVLGFASASIYRDATIWRVPYDPEESAAFERRYMSLAQEDSYYLQPKLLERELAEIKPGRKGTIDLFFIGAAGWADQDVFMKEVKSVSRLFQDRFGTAGRTIRLVNNQTTAAELPIASVTSLRRALARVAESMDRDEDILFLFLTSHGSQDHRFSLQFYPLKFHELTPAKLRQLLDESGIKRRVLVVSACYSGGFIDALKDENSLIITAAAPDRNSFGCSNEAEFTYFGKAYFDEALRETYSFVDAFELAKPRIAERERKGDHKPSDPRIFIGDAIRAPLAELERSLREERAAPPAAAKLPVKDRYTELAELWLVPQHFELYREQCLRNMAKASPATYVEKDPHYFGGLDRSAAHWPQWMAAWETYAEEYCATTNDTGVYRRNFEKAWREGLDPAAVTAAVQFFHTPLGRHFIQAEAKASLRANTALLEQTQPAVDRATRKLQETQTRINADFMRTQERKNK